MTIQIISTHEEFTDEEILGVENYIKGKLQHIMEDIEPENGVIMVTVRSNVTTFKVIRFFVSIHN